MIDFLLMVSKCDSLEYLEKHTLQKKKKKKEKIADLSQSRPN